MQKLTPQNIQDLIAHVQKNPEYKNDARVKALVDEKADRLRILAAGDLDVAETLEKIDAVIKEIAAAIKVVRIPEANVTPMQQIDAIRQQTRAEIFSVLGGLQPPEIIKAELWEKLRKSVDTMIITLDRFGYNDSTIPNRQKVFDAIKKLSPEMLEAINNFGKPTVVITPPGSFEDKVDRINFYKNMHGQNPTNCVPAPTDGVWGAAPTAWAVTIVDGVDAMPQPSYITDDLNIGQKMDKYEEEFAKKKLEIMSCQEGAMLLMQSLRLGKPIDDYQSTDTVTYYNRKHLTKSSVVPFGFWSSKAHEVFFLRDAPGAVRNGLRCRPSLRVLVET